MSKYQISPALIVVVGLLGLVLCAGIVSVGLGSGVAWWLITSDSTQPSPTRRPVAIAALPTDTPVPPTPTPTGTPSPTPAPLLPTTTPVPTDTPAPPTSTPEPTATPTETPSPLPPPPTATPPPTETFTPEPPPFPFIIKEQATFETNHYDFDVYLAIVNGDNGPLANYKIIGTHSSGLVVESQPSAGDWTVNSGAKHYKGGNLKYEVPNSSGGVWTLQLINPEGRPVAPPVDMPFDADHPTWQFIIFEHHGDAW